MEDNIIIHLCSKKKTTGFATSFKIVLPLAVSRIKSFEVLGAEIPYTFYNLPTGNKAFCDTSGATSTGSSVYSPDEIYTSPLILMFSFDGDQTPVDVSGYSQLSRPNFTDIGSMIVNAAPHGCYECTMTLIGYKINIFMRTSQTFTKVTVKLIGTDSTLASYLGLNQDAVFESPHPTNVANIRMPSLYQQFNHKDISRYLTSFVANGNNSATYIAPIAQILAQIYTPTIIQVVPYMEISVYDTNPQHNSPITINYNKHILAYKLGIPEGTYIIGARFPLPTYFIPPMVYEWYGFDVVVGLFEQSYTLTLNMNPGNYTVTDIINAINQQLQSIPQLAGSVASIDPSTGRTIIDITVATPGPYISLVNDRYTGRTLILDKLGFSDQIRTPYRPIGSYSVGFVTVDGHGSNISTARFISSNKFKRTPNYLRIQSHTLASLISTEYMEEDDPLFQISNIIHKIQVKALPGGVITDNQKYTTRKMVTKMRTPLTSIDITLYDEDNQIVDLNGSDWCVTIRLNL